MEILCGTLYRLSLIHICAPILVKGINPYIPTWEKPITLARHAYGDVYRNTELQVAAGSKAELVVTDAQGNETRALIHQFKGGGVVQGMHNLDGSITSFARVCFDYALDTKQDLWFATKDTISKKYDHRFKDIFQEIFDEEYKERFEAAGLEYFYTLIDDAVSRVIRSRGGFIWACKNYDGDVMSDMVATAFGSLGMMTSVLVSPDGAYEYEAAHGTVTRHYYKYLKGEKTSTLSLIHIFIVADKAALYPDGLLAADGGKQHITAPQQLLSAAHIQNRPRIHLRRDGQGNPAWNIRLNQPGNNIHRGPLRGNHQMHSSGTGHLGEAADGILHFIRRRHHQVRQLVHNNDYLRHMQHGLPLVIRIIARGRQRIVAGQVPYIAVGKNFIALEHLGNGPVQRPCRFTRIGDNGHQQMRKAVISVSYTHLHVKPDAEANK